MAQICGGFQCVSGSCLAFAELLLELCPTSPDGVEVGCVLAQRDHEDCRWPQRNGSALRAGIFEALGSIDPISVGHRRFGEESRNRTIQPQCEPMALW